MNTLYLFRLHGIILKDSSIIKGDGPRFGGLLDASCGGVFLCFPLNSLLTIYLWVCLHLYMEAFGLVYLCGLFFLKNSMTQSVITLFSSDNPQNPLGTQ